MNRREYVRNLAASPVGIALGAVAVSVGGFLGIRIGPVVGFVSGFATLAGFLIVISLAGVGSTLAAAEQRRRAWAATRPRLDAARDARNRLASLRIPDPEIKALLELVATRGTAYLSACESARSHDPLAEDALAESVSIADLYLKELDSASTEKRFGLADADPFADAKARTGSALRAQAAVVEKATLDLSGGLSSADRMDIKESL
jgi:hypothetical protein